MAQEPSAVAIAKCLAEVLERCPGLSSNHYDQRFTRVGAQLVFDAGSARASVDLAALGPNVVNVLVAESVDLEYIFGLDPDTDAAEFNDMVAIVLSTLRGQLATHQTVRQGRTIDAWATYITLDGNSARVPRERRLLYGILKHVSFHPKVESQQWPPYPGC